MCNISANTIGIKVGKLVNSQYLLWFLTPPFGQEQFARFCSGHVQSKITTDDVKFIRLPLAPHETQDKIAQITQNACRERKEKLAKAEELVNSIEDYVLTKLEIKVPPLEEKKRFVINKEDLAKRLDPYFCQRFFISVLTAIEKSGWGIEKLSHLTESTVSGKTPQGQQKYQTKGIPFVRIQNIVGDRLVLNSLIYISANFHEENLASEITNGDILLAITGATIGKVAVVENLEKGNICGDLPKIRVNALIANPYFVYAFLRSKMGQFQIKRNIYGATNKHLASSDVKNILLPSPPIEIQNLIAGEVKRCQKETERLHQQAQSIIKEAKQKAAAMILGEATC